MFDDFFKWKPILVNSMSWFFIDHTNVIRIFSYWHEFEQKKLRAGDDAYKKDRPRNYTYLHIISFE